MNEAVISKIIWPNNSEYFVILGNNKMKILNLSDWKEHSITHEANEVNVTIDECQNENRIIV